MPIEQFPAVFLFRFAATAEKRPAAASGIASNNPILFIADLFRGLYSCLCVFAVPSSKIEKTPKLYKYDSPDSEYQSAFMRRDLRIGEDYQSEERYRKSRATPPYGYADNSRAGAMQAPYAAPCRGK